MFMISPECLLKSSKIVLQLIKILGSLSTRMKTSSALLLLLLSIFSPVSKTGCKLLTSRANLQRSGSNARIKIRPEGESPCARPQSITKKK